MGLNVASLGFNTILNIFSLPGVPEIPALLEAVALVAVALVTVALIELDFSQSEMKGINLGKISYLLYHAGFNHSFHFHSF